MSFREIINTCDLSTNRNRSGLYYSLKKISKHLPNLSFKNKNDLMVLCRQLDQYTKKKLSIIPIDDQTTTNSSRVKYLLDTCTTPDKILILTFSSNTCNDFKRRLKQLIGFDFRMCVYTMNSFVTSLYYNYYYNFEDTVSSVISLDKYYSCAIKILDRFGHIICKQYEFLFLETFQNMNTDQKKIVEQF